MPLSFCCPPSFIFYTSLFYFIKRKNNIYTVCQAGYLCGSKKLLWQIFVAGRCLLLKGQRSGQELLAMCRRTALQNMVRKIIQPWWIRKQIALTVARLPSWGLRCCRPKEPLSEPRRGEFRRRAANRRANRTGNAACQDIVFESSWRYIFYKIISMAFICTF